MTTAHQLAAQLASDIAQGRLLPGSRLPTHRALAQRAGVAVATVSKAYALLRTQGLTVGETGRGTFVRESAAPAGWDVDNEARPRGDMIDLSFNHPSDPAQTTRLRRWLRHTASQGDLARLLHQQPPGGRMHERAIVTDWLHTQGLVREGTQTHLVNGAQHGLDIAARAVLRPGDTLAVDALTYPGIRLVAEALRLRLLPIPVTTHGTDVAALAAACARGGVRACYVQPALHNPLGGVWTPADCQQLAEVAQRHDVLVIEDATYAFLNGPRAPSVQALAPEQTLLVGSLSKGVGSGLRFGWLVTPTRLANAVQRQIRANLWSLPSLITAAATDWIADGSVDQAHAQARRDARARQRIASEQLGALGWQAHPGALFGWLPLPADLRQDRIVTALATHGIAVSQARAYATTPHAPHALRLGLSSLPRAQLPEVLRTVAEVITQFPP